ncbi:GC-rich sequence DNA-binding factor-like protein-domain-containing protein [Pilobolus umbonatus]|nr:GC-rich sequence DNA-binding factor-like protein-domain-containing protein [Pilobolus umbonatus]
MGWKIGKGLGAEGEGIVNPVETKLRPARMGLSFRGFDERTEQAKYDRGESEEEEEAEDVERVTKRNAWRESSADIQPKIKKKKKTYKTAADIIAETIDVLPPSQQKVIDMTGPNIREISISDIKRTDSPTLMETTTRMPELRHNIRLIVDLSRSDLENLSREKQTSALKMKSLEEEVDKIKEGMEIEKQRLMKYKRVKEIVQEAETISRNALATGAFESGHITSLFGEQFGILEEQFLSDINSMHLDAVVISLWAPVWKYQCMHWDVIQDPTYGVIDVKRWKKLLITDEDNRPKERTATPYETMMNTIWLSRVRSAINNKWDIHDPEPIIQLMEEWEPVLPQFIYENIINQLILPKISQAVSDWNPRTDPVMIHVWTHPWLPTLKAWRLSDLFTSIRHKLSVVLRQWHPSDESALHIISPWKDVWTSEQLELFTTKSVIPKLAHVLSQEFEINPRDQNIEPLIWCLAWNNLISDTVMGQLLENEFFNKWWTVLQRWLSLDITRVNYDEISDWYRWWKEVFMSYGLHKNKTVMNCFRKGLEMMNEAIGGDDLYSMGLSKK